MPISAFIRYWVEHQIDVIVRRTEYRLRKDEAAIHILRGYLKALDALDEVIALIRRSPSSDEARTGLMELLEVDEVQATAILNLQLRRLAALERQKIIDEHDEIEALPRAISRRPTGGDRVFVHGFRGDHHGLALLADALPEHPIHSIELPGFGASEPFPHAEHTVAHHADAVAAVIAALGLPAAPVLVAHSYGTTVAAELVARDPSRWGRLVLLNPIAEPASSHRASRKEARATAASTQAAVTAVTMRRAPRWFTPGVSTVYSR